MYNDLPENFRRFLYFFVALKKKKKNDYQSIIINEFHIPEILSEKLLYQTFKFSLIFWSLI